MTSCSSSNSFYEVEKIIAFKKIKSKKLYLIKWENYPVSQCTWEPSENLSNVRDMVKEFEKDYPNSVDKKMYQEFLGKIDKKTNEINNLSEKSKKNGDFFKINRKVNKRSNFLHKKVKRSKNENSQSKKYENLELELYYEDNHEDYYDLLRKHLYIKVFAETKCDKAMKNVKNKEDTITYLNKNKDDKIIFEVTKNNGANKKNLLDNYEGEIKNESKEKLIEMNRKKEFNFNNGDKDKLVMPVLII